MLLCVFVVAEQATVEQAKVDDEAEMTQGKVEQAKVDEAEMKQAKVDEATGCIGRQGGKGEGIDQACFAFLDSRSVSFSFLVSRSGSLRVGFRCL